jgi:hypothetical protein
MGDELMPRNVGFHLKPRRIGYVNSSDATVTAAVQSSAGATNCR